MGFRSLSFVSRLAQLWCVGTIAGIKGANPILDFDTTGFEQGMEYGTLHELTIHMGHHVQESLPKTG